MLSAGGRFPATSGKTFVIQQETDGDTNPCVVPGKASAAMIASVIADYVTSNAKRWVLRRKFKIAKPYILISREEFQGFFNGNPVDGWKAFYVKYPESGGVVEFSAVGFNHRRTIAMVRMSTGCGPLCAGGTYHFLQKKNGKWQPLELKDGRSCAWAS